MKKCKDCGRELPEEMFYKYTVKKTGAEHIYSRCIDCETKHRIELRSSVEDPETDIKKEKKKPEKKPKKKTIDDIQKEAMEHNMSYGQYVAWLEGRKNADNN